MMKKLTFVTLLAYDYRYAELALRSYYDIADEILLGIDADRLSWMKLPFHIDMDEVRALVADIDREGKIRIIEGNFHSSDDPMANDVLERTVLAGHAAPGNWIIQIDSDEILLNGAEFRDWLWAQDPVHFDVQAQWITVFKKFSNQFLLIDPPGESVPVATMARNSYRLSRNTGQPHVMSPLKLLHLSYGRTPEEVLQKLTNWGHARDFDVHCFFRFWQSISLDNYTQARDFHPLTATTWRSLKLVEIGTAVQS